MDNTINTERALLAALSEAMSRFEAGVGSECDLLAARQALRRFYQGLGMHP